ncbi:MAG TPA: glycoside hydrolase family 2 TIM barrel-domain containing protein [Polyangia bacterium]|jgi:beta-glucuronidase|nr:glycoside hydrolase family 2 TIM barrel-domain containing protein [Polyangia bacterium]
MSRRPNLWPLVALAGALWSASASAAPTALGFADARSGQSLDGAWHVIVDPYDNGLLDYRNQPRPNGYFEDAPPKNRSDLVEYDFARSPTLNVPGDWNTQRPELLYYEGTVWYERRFDAPAVSTAGARQFLQFGAAAQRAIVWLNGRRLGEHEGGFTPFAFEVTAQLRPRDNSLVVMVNNTRRPGAIPAMNTDWWNYGGLTRGVRLIDTPAVFVRAARVQCARSASRRIAGFVALDGARGPTSVSIDIPELRAHATAQTDAAGRATFDFPAAPALWSPEAPKLYDVTITAGADRVHDQIGFRTIETAGTEIRLNGRSIFLRGISLHEEALVRGGRATSRADAEALLGLAKELGCNFVRLAHYPHNDEMTRAADRMGLLVWSELPVYWTIAWDNPDTLANARQQLGEEIARDANRASVVLWSVGNETPVTEARTRFLRTLVADARAADPTRLLTAALEHHPAGAHGERIDDPLGADLDVLGLNEYVGWYDGLPAKCDTLGWSAAFAKPIVVSELGADAKAGMHGDALTRFSEEYQADLYRRQLAMLRRVPAVRGMSPWILVDFRSPRRPLPGVQDGWNRKGLVANDGTKKQAFGVLRDAYRALAAQAR